MELMHETVEIRNRIEKVESTRIRMALKFQFLCAARASEVCGAYAIHGENYQLDNYEGNPLVIFNITTAKTEELRYAALPLEEKYEPWTMGLVEYFEKARSKKAFDFSTRLLRLEGSKIFSGLTYPISKYTPYGLKENGEKREPVKTHLHTLATHGLRHYRASELMMYYRFDEVDLRIYCGWTLPGSMSKYVMKEWFRYFPKLLKPLDTVPITALCTL